MKNMHALYTYVLALLCLFLLLPFSVTAQASKDELKGTYFESTRVIYDEGSRQGESIVLNNNGADNFLVQAYIVDAKPDTGMVALPSKDFIVTPPLNRVGAHQTLPLRVLRTGGQFPEDRESLFYLTVRLIPTGSAPSPEDKGIQIKYLSALAIKVFYRPHKLASSGSYGGVREAVKKLKVSVSGKELVMNNPTPYWITLRTLSVGETPVSAVSLTRMIPPFGQQRWALPAMKNHAPTALVKWTAITETGFDTDPFQGSVKFPATTVSVGK